MPTVANTPSTNKNLREPVYVTRSFIPPQVEYLTKVQAILERGQLTNHGPCVTELEEKLRQALGVRHLVIMSNGTLAIQLALKALEKTGEVITTPFSYVATVSSVVWEGCTPVFAGIRPSDLSLDPIQVERLIGPNTVAILATHVYGFPCQVDEFERLGRKYNIPVIYDAAHAYGVSVGNRSLMTYGTMSTLSFHATKVFHSGEGGAVVTESDELAHKLRYLRNFGHNGEEAFWGLGVNAKMSELHGAMGLSVLPHMTEIIGGRQKVWQRYQEILAGSGVYTFSIPAGVVYNFSYYPCLMPSEEALLAAKSELNGRNIFPRRYFFPSLDTLPYVTPSNDPVVADACRRVLCLPLHPTLDLAVVDEVCEVLKRHAR